MFNKNQIVAFITSFFIAGLFVFTFVQLTPKAYAGGAICCVGSIGGQCQPEGPCSIEECPGSQSSPICDGFNNGVTCECLPPPTIPTLNQWGKMITMALIGLFAVIGIFAMRRRSALTN